MFFVVGWLKKWSVAPKSQPVWGNADLSMGLIFILSFLKWDFYWGQANFYSKKGDQKPRIDRCYVVF